MSLRQQSKNNTEELHIVSKRSTLSVFAFILSCLLIFKPFFLENADVAHNNSINKAKSLAYQALELEMKKTQLNQNTLGSSREPASAALEQGRGLGMIGKNEDGRPYHYEIIRGSSFTRVTIWSNQHSASKTEVLIPSEIP